MDTQNIKITNQGWQNLATVGGISFTTNGTYAITARGAGVCELVISSTEPETNFLGHIINADESFNFTFTSGALWLKCRQPMTIVIS